jgi:hypothetical protein
MTTDRAIIFLLAFALALSDVGLMVKVIEIEKMLRAGTDSCEVRGR